MMECLNEKGKTKLNPMIRKCEQCTNEFYNKRKGIVKYCSKVCKQLAYINRNINPEDKNLKHSIGNLKKQMPQKIENNSEENSKNSTLIQMVMHNYYTQCYWVGDKLLSLLMDLIEYSNNNAILLSEGNELYLNLSEIINSSNYKSLPYYYPYHNLINELIENLSSFNVNSKDMRISNFSLKHKSELEIKNCIEVLESMQNKS